MDADRICFNKVLAIFDIFFHRNIDFHGNISQSIGFSVCFTSFFRFKKRHFYVAKIRVLTSGFRRHLRDWGKSIRMTSRWGIRTR